MSDHRARTHTQDLDGLVELLAAARTVTVLSGAGISTASGLPDFRSEGGLWEHVDPMTECSLTAFRADPARFWAFYTDRLVGYDHARPNPAHRAITDLQAIGKIRWVLTQNIDGFHQQAGSTDVIELHGSPRTVSCLDCPHTITWQQAMDSKGPDGVPRCPAGHPLKPDVVLFEEQLPQRPFEQAHLALAHSDVLMCLGSSLQVHPVAGLPAMMCRGGGQVVIITASTTPCDPLAEIKLDGPLEELLPALAGRLRDRA